jgi:hypothetical protein
VDFAISCSIRSVCIATEKPMGYVGLLCSLDKDERSFAASVPLPGVLPGVISAT